MHNDDDNDNEDDARFYQEWQIVSNFISDLGPLLIQYKDSIRREGQAQRLEGLVR